MCGKPIESVPLRQRSMLYQKVKRIFGILNTHIAEFFSSESLKSPIKFSPFNFIAFKTLKFVLSAPERHCISISL